MWRYTIIFILGSLLHVNSTIWTCTQDSDCSFTAGAVCSSGSCLCPPGQQLALGGTVCADWSPYYSSPCAEHFQCLRLLTNFQCRNAESGQEGNCFCQDGAHYLFGRCWQSSDYSESCTRDEDCMGGLRDPFSLACNGETGVCVCAPGYYRRQRGECRKIGNAVGEGCVLDEDCQFTNGACDRLSFTCFDSSASSIMSKNPSPKSQQNGDLLRHIITKATSIQNSIATKQFNASGSPRDGAVSRQHGAVCNTNDACAAPFTCSSFGLCACPAGYYSIDGGNACYAELGSPSTEEQCIGILSEVRDGICTCPPNFYFNEDYRDCVKVVRALSDSCLNDDACKTFGAAVRCGDPTPPWGTRTCECLTEFAVWDQERSMCRLFAGIGEACVASSDCLAGNMEIECVFEEGSDEGFCACPEGTTAQDGLCLTAGLDLGDACQVSQECTAAANSGCYDGFCRCTTSYVEVNGICAPSIGGLCTADSDCVVMDNLVCANNQDTGVSTCQCSSEFVEYGGQCWEPISDADSACNVTIQCTAVMGEFSACREERCVCAENAHYRDDRCWPQIGLFAACSRTSECFLQDISERVVCRNSRCQCSFDYPYSEELNTCTGRSAATMSIGSLSTIVLALYLVLSQ